MTKLWREKDAELQEAHAKLAEAQEKETALRKMILDKAGTQRVSDEEVKDSFVAIRQKVQAIARSSAFDVEQRPRITGYYDRKLVDFYEEWESLTAKDRKSRLRAKIFACFRSSSLNNGTSVCLGTRPSSRSVMGWDDTSPWMLGWSTLKSVSRARKVSALGRKTTRTQFPDCWGYSRQRPNLGLEDRDADCVDRLGLKPKTARLAADKIFDFFVPILSKEIMETGDATELQAHIRKVCDNAFKLAMVMRRSRDGYKCETPPVRRGPVC